VTDNAR